MPVAPSEARWRSPRGEWGEQVWGSHSTQSQRPRPVVSVRHTRATSAGEWRLTSWATTARVAPSRSGAAPHRPREPSSRRLTTIGTWSMVENRSRSTVRA